ncbi:type I restriction endonuclease [Filimonas effusa]|uniref:Restriction endonuclease n=1 Tax=Filimonas effusa TaxID=2508721 RepID=A0A4Q1D5H4_9BACT|nr:type I restriction endonuclease [Filimonas effusa]RXK83760.1 restriction endonuclease [Filimonas effusa]
MDFKDTIKQLAERILKHKELVHTEEATKHSFVMPFLQALGYDVFNPMEVVPEFIADLGIKKGEKVDYAIVKDGQPIILVECKHWSASLDPHNSQLFRYFHTTKAKFSILTNGFESRFYTDLDEQNKMDEKPFFIFDVNDIRDNQLEELKKFHKTYFDSETIVSTASELKYVGQLKTLLQGELNNPTQDFVRHFAKQVYTAGILTQRVMDQFTQLTKKSFQYYINDLITERLKSALHKEETEQVVISAPEAAAEENKIITTQEELDSFQIVRSILRQHVPVQKISHRDAQSYFAILFEDNNRKPICRMYLNGGKKYIGLFDNEKNETKKEITTLDDIFLHADALLGTLMNYMPKVEA